MDYMTFEEYKVHLNNGLILWASDEFVRKCYEEYCIFVFLTKCEQVINAKNYNKYTGFERFS